MHTSFQAPPPVKKPVLPVVLVAGFSQSARHRLIREALLGDQVRSIAWLDHQDAAVVLDAPTPTQSFVACVCCSGSLVFTTYLARLLRQQPWEGLFISLGARAEPGRMLNLLASSTWSAHLGPVKLFSVMDELSDSILNQPEHALHDVARQQQELAEKLIRSQEHLPADLWSGH